MDGTGGFEPAPASRRPLGPEELRSVRVDLAASTALLPIAPEMAWAVPQLLKRVQILAPGVRSTSGVLRALIRMPGRDADFAHAFTESGFMSCDEVIARVRWKYDIRAMADRERSGSASQVLKHCRAVLAGHRTRQPVDWNAVLLELQKLHAWFPELRTIVLLEQLYTRLYVLHVKGVLIAQCWLDWRGGTAT
jgi:hypothetical protein